MKFKKSIELEIVDYIDEDDNITSHNECFKKGEIVDGDLVSENDDNIQWQFPDGSTTFCPKDCVDFL